MAYTPNFSDPRTIARAKIALGYTIATLSQTHPKQLWCREINEYFGRPNNNLGHWLRQHLLCEETSYYNPDKGVCKTYLYNYANAKQLFELLHPDKPFNIKEQLPLVNKAILSTKPQFELELLSGNFNYTDKSYRNWHPLQNIKSSKRKPFFAQYGYTHIYDIKTAAPTVIYHLAKNLTVKHTVRPRRHLPVLHNYIQNSRQIRQQIAQDTGLDVKIVKRVINAICAGALLKACTRSSIFTEVLRYNYVALRLLQSNSALQELKDSITWAWQVISKSTINDTPIMPNQYNKKLRINSKDKWNVYFEYERLIMDVVVDYMKREYCRYFIEHDGWSCDVELPLQELTDYVKLKTGIDCLEFDYELTE